MPLYSFITVASGDPKRLRWTARSLQVQIDAPSFEWIVVGDVAPALLAEFPDLSVTHLPQAEHALNAGMAAATGDYIWFLAAGDCLSDAFVLRDVKKELVSLIRPDFFYGAARENGFIKPARPYHAFAQGMIAPLAVMLFRRSILNGITFDPQYGHAGGYDVVLRFLSVVTKIGAGKRVLADIETALPSEEDARAERTEKARIRTALLHQAPWKNAFYTRIDRWGFALRKNHPRLHRLIRSWFVPFTVEKKPSPVQSRFKFMRR